jgi:hypothetical protein
MANMEKRKRKRSAQWAAQYLVASELERNGYEVAFMTGNTPILDLIAVHSETGDHLSIDVKGQWQESAWIGCRPKPERLRLFYVLTVVGKNRNNRFFVLTQSEFNGLVEAYKNRRAGASDPHIGQSFDFKDAVAFEDQWDKLPGWERG